MMLSKDRIAEFLNVFSVNLRRHRVNSKLSYDGVSKITGISKSILSRMENGQTAPSFDTFLRLYVFFNVTTDFFLAHPASGASPLLNASDDIISGVKFKKVNFLGRPTIAAEIEILAPNATVNLQARRSQEESVLILNGECSIAYSGVKNITLAVGDIYTSPPNRQEYLLTTFAGAKIMRITAPLSTDKSGGTRYRTVIRRSLS